MTDGVWQSSGINPSSPKGAFNRAVSTFRHWVTPDGSPGPDGVGGFAAESGRYHLYVSLACPWAHRALIFRRLKNLTAHITVSNVHPLIRDQGWTFEEGPGVSPDPVMGAEALHQLYAAADPMFSGRVTVPVLWDRHRKTIVNNESSEIIRMFDSAFDGVGAEGPRFFAEALESDIVEVMELVYPSVNNGVYRAGFATTQASYEDAVQVLFSALDTLEERLSTQRYLCGDQITGADWCLLPTLLRFDAVYYCLFKCNIRRLVAYENLWAYTRDLYQVEGVAETLNMDHVKQHYFGSLRMLNPTGIVPVGPSLDFDAPHRRG
jgi:glutathionyl-hydroquinone reductase